MLSSNDLHVFVLIGSKVLIDESNTSFVKTDGICLVQFPSGSFRRDTRLSSRCALFRMKTTSVLDRLRVDVPASRGR